MADTPRIDPTHLGLVVAGGAVGAVARAALTLPADGPVAVWVVNIAGSFLLGITVGVLAEKHPRWRMFLGTGVLGAFTTYSAFAVSTVELTANAPLLALAGVAVSVLLGVLLAAAGLSLGRRIGRGRDRGISRGSGQGIGSGRGIGSGWGRGIGRGRGGPGASGRVAR